MLLSCTHAPWQGFQLNTETRWPQTAAARTQRWSGRCQNDSSGEEIAVDTTHIKRDKHWLTHSNTDVHCYRVSRPPFNDSFVHNLLQVKESIVEVSTANEIERVISTCLMLTMNRKGQRQIKAHAFIMSQCWYFLTRHKDTDNFYFLQLAFSMDSFWTILILLKSTHITSFARCTSI